jgi:prepilin-type processing-associated H-X9-DG protein/prepilin-type N-terminal cleavage/methylation domain-containing protein
MQLRPNFPKLAFTLVEVLVVVAIVGFLAALLLSYLKDTQIRAQGAACLSNLRVLAGGVQGFAADHNGLYPSGMADGLGGISKLARYVNVTAASGEILGGPPFRKTCLLCPSVFRDGGDPQKLRSYGINSKVGDNIGATSDPLVSVALPSQTLLMADAKTTSWIQAVSHMSFRHTGARANVLFFDGHTESLTASDAGSRPPHVFIRGLPK